MADLGLVRVPIVSRNEAGRARVAPIHDNELVFESPDGLGNNLVRPMAGSTALPQLRTVAAAYDTPDGLARSAGTNARMVSNRVIQGSSPDDPNNMSNMLWVWGQFIDHTVVLTPSQTGAGAEKIYVPVPSATQDPLEPHPYPGRTIEFTRSQFTHTHGVRQQPNGLASFLDAANVYGVSHERSHKLRRMDGTGKLRTGLSALGGDLLPMNTDGAVDMDPGPLLPLTDVFAAGDVRANENVALTAMHTLWVREHNRLCDAVVRRHPDWAGEDETIFQHARRLVRSYQQSITLYEWLPKIIGPLPVYAGYRSGVDAGIATEFATVGFRFGHTALPDALQVGATPGTTLALLAAFFNPAWIVANDIETILAGAANSVMKAIDPRLVETVRSMLFGPPTTTAMQDLATANIMRGRDHGIPGYSALRVAYGLSAINNWADFPCTADNRDRLTHVYATPSDVDPWVGMLCEIPLPGKLVGPLAFAIIKDQFERLRDGDRFWFENDAGLSAAERVEARRTTLAEVIARNTGLTPRADQFEL